ncbi:MULTISPECIES: hypothetical protein [unclassified Schaalia]|uniref:hypothetical protein n=1 Tax=unclassified Schaalia TaxID=2691889 RepID=UPI001E4361BF|nr:MULTISPECIES: hypothetical protein [unclassified Schaalia]
MDTVTTGNDPQYSSPFPKRRDLAQRAAASTDSADVREHDERMTNSQLGESSTEASPIRDQSAQASQNETREPVDTADTSPRFPLRRDVVHSDEDDDESQGGILDTFFRKLSVPAGLRVSAITVLILSAGAVGVWFLPGAQWTFIPVIGLAGVLLAAGWPRLTGVRIRSLTQGVLVLSAPLIPLTVALTQDLRVAVSALALAIVALVITSILEAPTPVDHHICDAPTNNEPRGAWYVEDTGQQVRPSWRTTSTMASLASGITALLIITGGSAWAALDSLNEWAVTVPIAAVVVAIVVWGNQIGSTFRSQSVAAVVSAIVAGIAAAVIAWALGHATALQPLVLPGLARTMGELAAIVFLGVATGISIALAIVVIDGLLGDHDVRQPPVAAVARGATKFLVAAVPVYVMIRVGGL